MNKLIIDVINYLDHHKENGYNTCYERRNALSLGLSTYADNFDRLEKSYQITCKNLEEKTKQVHNRNMQIKDLKAKLAKATEIINDTTDEITNAWLNER